MPHLHPAALYLFLSPRPSPRSARGRPGVGAWRALPAALLCLVLGPGCARRPPPLPSGGRIAHYAIPWPNAFPSDVAVDDRGRLWFTDRLTHALGRFDPEDRTFRRFETPTPRSAPYGLVRGPAGLLWFGESNGGRLGRLDPESGTITEVEIPGLQTGPRLLAWADGALWFTAEKEDAYGRYDPATGAHRLWRGLIERPYGIAAAGDGVWVAAKEGSRLFRVDRPPREGDSLPSLDLSEAVPNAVPAENRARWPRAVVEAMLARRAPAGIRRMAGGPDGRIWVSAFARGRVTGVEPHTGERVHVETLDQPSLPYGITTDRWGRIWYAEQGNDTVVVYDPDTGERRVIELPVPGGTVRHIAVDAARRRVWLPLSDVGVIAVIELPDS